MDFLNIAMRMLPCWILGFSIILAVLCSEHKSLLRINWHSVGTWLKIVAFISTIRYIMLKLTMDEQQIEVAMRPIHWIPWQITLFTPWEDAVFVLPIALFSKFTNKKWQWIKYPLIALSAIGFGSGHLYQGLTTAILLSLYVPITLSIAKKRGFGTIMLSHIIYDLSTIIVIKYLI